MKKNKLLIADDHPMIIEGLVTLLQKKEQLEVVRVVTQINAIIPSLHHTQPTILILDMNMNGKSTFTIVPEIKEKFPDLKSIAFTSYDTPVFRKEAVRLGIHAFLTKNASKEELLNTINKILKGEVAIKVSRSFYKNQEQLQDQFLIIDKLSKRELEILKLVAQGNTSQQIGETLFISKQTVQWHRKNIIAKLELKTPGEMIKIAHEYGLV